MMSIFRADPGRKGPAYKIALFGQKIKAGFPSPADSYAEKRLDLNDLAVRNPAATFFLQVSGHSMAGAGILDGDYVVVDRSLSAKAGDIVVAELGGEFTLKRLDFEGGAAVLRAANPAYPDIRPAPEAELSLFGVVRGVFRSLKP